MRKLILHFFVISTIACFLIACGSSQNTTETTTETKPVEVKEEKPADTVKTEAQPVALAGKGTYTTYCSVCHQADGKGVPGMNPPLANKEWVGGDKTKLIKIVLNGLNEPITVNGEKYQNVMASHDFLNDKQIADVLTYVRKSFGNDFEAITEAEVNEVRKNNKK